jgi:hypothetical protein
MKKPNNSIIDNAICIGFTGTLPTPSRSGAGLVRVRYGLCAVYERESEFLDRPKIEFILGDVFLIER